MYFNLTENDIINIKLCARGGKKIGGIINDETFDFALLYLGWRILQHTVL